MSTFRVGRSIRTLDQAIKDYFKENYACKLPDGLVGFEGAVIGYLFHHQDEEITLNDIVGLFSINKSSASEMLSKLVNGGFVSVCIDKEDRRRKILSLTQKGKKHQEEAKKVFDAFEEDLCAELSEEEKTSLQVIINKIYKNIGGSCNGK